MRRAAVVLLLSLAAPAAAGQTPPPATVEVRVERVAPGVAVLFGRGGNVGLS